MTAIKGLHHAAYRCRDSEETRAFYQDFLDLPLIDAFEISASKSGRDVHVLHTFYRMENGGCLAFFEEPGEPFEFKAQRDFDLHIALEVDYPTLEAKLAQGHSAGIETRGISDHGFIHSIYFRDPNGYVIELTAPVGSGVEDADQTASAANTLMQWQRNKASAASG